MPWTPEQICKLPLRYRQEIAAQAHGMSLIGPHGSVPLKEKKTLPSSLIPSESVSQQDLIRWWQSEAMARGIDERLLMAFPLQGLRTPGGGARMKAEGQRRGTPDMLLAIRRGTRCGLWIEQKTERKGSKPSPYQLEMLSLLSKDYATAVCYSTEEAKQAVLTYLGT